MSNKIVSYSHEAALTGGVPHEHEHHESSSVFGLWIYLMSDCILFGSLFATYAVLRNAFAGAPGPEDIFELPFVLIETFVLLLSSGSYGFAMLAARRGAKSQVISWLCVTFILGLTFVAMEVYEFHHLISHNIGPSHSAFLSAYFTLVGTHGLHVTAGLLWMAILIHQVATKGLTAGMQTRLSCLSLFWHFLDLVWICVFTVVYLFGVF